MATKLRCHGNNSVDVNVRIIYSQIILVKVAKFGGHSLYGFKFIKLFKERGLGLNRDNNNNNFIDFIFYNQSSTKQSI